MIRRLMDRWSGVEWRLKLAFAAFSFWLVLSFVIGVVFVGQTNRSARECSLKSGKVLISWFADKARDAVDSGGVEMVNISKIAAQPNVRRAAVIDSSGKVVVPAKYRGEVVDMPDLHRILGRPLIVFNGRSMLLYQEIGGVSGNVAFIEFVQLRTPVGGLIVFLSVVLLLSFSFFVLYVMRTTRHSIGVMISNPVCRWYSPLKDQLCEMSDRSKNSMSDRFISSLRKLMHIIEEPAILLDKNFRLLEVNIGASQRFRIRSGVKEGVHMIDMIEDEYYLSRFRNILNGLDIPLRGHLQVSEEDMTVSILALGIEGVLPEYIIVCPDRREL